MFLKFYVNIFNRKVSISPFNSSSNLVIEGVSEKVVNNGVVIFDDLKIYFTPQTNSTIKIKATNIEKYYKNYLTSDNFPFENEVNNDYYYSIDLTFKKCDIGEVYRQQIQKYFNHLRKIFLTIIQDALNVRQVNTLFWMVW